MPKKQINQSSYPALFAKYAAMPNFSAILQVIADDFGYLFDIEALETAITSHKTSCHYFSFFDSMISGINTDFYTKDEILPILANKTHAAINTDTWSEKTYAVPDPLHSRHKPSLKQCGFYEKLTMNALTGNLGDAESLRQYAFNTVDMHRSARRFRTQDNKKVRVCELQHLSHITPHLNIKNNPLFIRSNSGDEAGLPQWILAYYNTLDGKMYLYSESPLEEEDKAKLLELCTTNGILENNIVTEGGSAALSMTSGMRTVARLVEFIGGAGLTATAEYASLLVEWVWFNQSFNITRDDLMKDYHSEAEGAPQFDWGYFKNHTLRYAALPYAEYRFHLLNFQSGMSENIPYNDHIQRRSYHLGLDWLMADPQLGWLKSDPKTGIVSLEVPADLQAIPGTIISQGKNLAHLYSPHGTKARFGFDHTALLKRTPLLPMNDESAAAAFVLNVFRACAKQKTLSITLPTKWNLDAREIDLVCFLMETNPFVCELKNVSDNVSLKTINNRLEHVFARNRWLSLNGYNPPVIGPFWDEAARYWIAYLKQSPDLLKEASEPREFKRCVKEMSIHGLIPVLEYLKREESALKAEFNKLLQNKVAPPIFYGGCAARDIRDYTNVLLTHLGQGNYFPFGHFMFSFVPGVPHELLDLLLHLNLSESFERISLTDCLANLGEFSHFMDIALRQVTHDDRWNAPIHIPELEEPSNNPDVNKIRMKYLQLNNILMQRARVKHAKSLDTIPAFKASVTLGTEAYEEKSDADDTEATPKLQAVEIRRRLQNTFGNQLREFHDSQFPLERAGGIALQMQQQQQIKQERTRCLDNESEKGTAYKDVLPSNLVTYDNIDEVLGEYYDALNLETPIDGSKAPLRRGSESPLQGFFHTWINAEPNVPAKHIIRKITPDAAKMMLKHHRQLSGGLNVYNLPKGFYTQRDAKGDLVLGFKSTLSYTTNNNPLTLKLFQDIPSPRVCLGDFRQLDPEKYNAGEINFEDEDTLDEIRLFSQLQPVISNDVKKNYDAFKKSSDFHKLTKGQQTFFTNYEMLIQEHWHLFFSLHQMQGTTGVNQFIQWKNNNKLTIDSPLDLYILFKKLPPNIKAYGTDLFRYREQESKRALAQIYFDYGDYGLVRFFNVLMTIETRLGAPFMSAFATHYLERCDTFTPLLLESALGSMDEMIRVLGDDPDAKRLWLSFLKMQIPAAGWDNITTLWKSYYYFYQQIKNMELHKDFKVSILENIKPHDQNLLVCFDRLILSLEKIPNAQQRRAFIKNLPNEDVTEGGVPYAVRHDDYSTVARQLKLHDFMYGTPSYSVMMQDLFTWSGAKGILYMQRALASKGRFNEADYNTLSAHITNTSLESKYTLLWALHTKFTNADEFLGSDLAKIVPDVFKRVAEHFHHVFYMRNAPYSSVPFNIFLSIQSFIPQEQYLHLLEKYKDSMVLYEAMKALFVYEQLDETNLTRVVRLMEAAPLGHTHCEQGLLLATIFGVDVEQLQQFYATTTALKQITRQELVILTRQLLSLDLEQTAPALLQSPEVWNTILQGITAINAHPMETAEYRKALVINLKTMGLLFKSSVAGDYRAVTDEDLTALSLESTFEQHSVRLTDLYKKHIVISEAQQYESPLVPLTDFFKRLQLNKTYINEVEPLLATLERIVLKTPGCCWTSTYFNALLRALQPKEGSTGFPIGFLEALLTEAHSPFAPVNIDEITVDFPAEWKDVFDTILAKSEEFSRDQQADLARIAVRMYTTSQDLTFVPSLMAQLGAPKFNGLRGVVLSYLLADSAERFAANAAECEALINNIPEDPLDKHWIKTSQLWIETLATHQELKPVLLTEGIDTIADPTMKALIMHIVAWSSFPSHQYPTVPHANYFTSKGPQSKVEKLIQRLQDLSPEDLTRLALCYPKKPAPDTRVLLGFIKKSQEKEGVPGIPVQTSLEVFLKSSDTAHRRDYEALSTTRVADLKRMLAETRVLRGSDNVPLKDEDSLKLSFMFQYLKGLEDGTQYIYGADRPIKDMDEEALREAFHELSQEDETEVINTQIWAILFEILGRTTEKYPHLAQQFALIANDVLLKDDPSSILQLKTGEGKSHFVAMRAARQAGLGRKVDVCTAKWTLAQRDLMDYQSFFEALGITTANVHARSDRETYVEAQVVYTTPGDLSLFLDEQASQGKPIVIPRQMRVGLGDEFDFLYYEGQKTQFNYARHTGVSPKEMSWFYRSLNAFYDKEIRPSASKTTPLSISKSQLFKCFEYLTKKAGEDDLGLLDDLQRNPIALVSWLQSVHEAATLVPDEQYTVRREKVKVGEEEFPLQEIYPLTKDMQAAVGSTFSLGVHQLLAERLNVEAMNKGLPQDYHVHPESNIVSSQVFSQRLKSLWGHWEGFTGTVSAAQAVDLNTAHQTAVLRVPTNQKDLRNWSAPVFFDGKKAQLDKMAHDIKDRIKHKKSILLCCATDAEVKTMVTALRPYFTEEEFSKHFLSHTNQSHLTADDILRQKKTMEGDYLGQKENGVVLIAAGFGRGDNVEVETVMLTSVHDSNDLGQKGGRTARNGEEGEVLQYYIKEEVDQQLEDLQAVLDSHKEIKDIITTDENCRNNLLIAALYLNHPMNDAEFTYADKFNMLLQIREFLEAKANQLSLVYHEAKARLSDTAITFIGRIDDPLEREKCSKEFARFLIELNKQWTLIQVHEAQDEDRIDRLSEYIKETLRQLDNVFQRKFTFEWEEPKPIGFELEANIDDLTPRQGLLLSVQEQWLKLDGLEPNPEQWAYIIRLVSGMEDEVLSVLLREYQNEPRINCEQFFKRIAMMAQSKKATSAVVYVKEENKKRLEEVISEVAPEVKKELSQLLLKLGTTESNLASEYLCSPGLVEIGTSVNNMLPMLRYVAQKNFTSHDEMRVSYFIDAQIRDSLLTLPPACFEGIVPVDAEVMHQVQQFLNKQWLPANDADYTSLFKSFVEGSQHQSQKRLRLISQYEQILKHSKQPTETLRHLARLSNTYQGTEHLAFLESMSAKFANAYKEHATDIPYIRRLDNVLKQWHDKHSDALAATGLINLLITIDGKEWLDRLEGVLTRVEMPMVIASQDFLWNYWPIKLNKALATKKYLEMLEHHQAWYLSHKDEFDASPGLLPLLFECFHAYPKSTEFKHSPDKTQQLEAMYLLLKQFSRDNVYGNNSQLIIDHVKTRFHEPQQMETLLAFGYEHKAQTSELAFNGVVDYFLAAPADKRAIIKEVLDDFYRRRSTNPIDVKTHPFFKGFTDASASQRVYWMMMVKEGVFVPNPDGTTGTWTAEKNQYLFDEGLKAYVAHVETTLTPTPTKNRGSRGLSSKQQTELYKVMGELQIITTQNPNPVHVVPTNEVFDGVVPVVQKHLQDYALSGFQNVKRLDQLKDIGLAFLAIDHNGGYLGVIQALKAMKTNLMKEDVDYASKQWFPTLHFWGQSRLYRTLNDIEDLVLKTMLADKAYFNQHPAEYIAFQTMMTEHQHDYIDALQKALTDWGASNQFSMFKGSAAKLQGLLAGKSDDEIIATLKSETKLVNSLPGTLLAIANEALAHSFDKPPGAAPVV